MTEQPKTAAELREILEQHWNHANFEAWKAADDAERIDRIKRSQCVIPDHADLHVSPMEAAMCDRISQLERISNPFGFNV